MQYLEYGGQIGSGLVCGGHLYVTLPKPQSLGPKRHTSPAQNGPSERGMGHRKKAGVHREQCPTPACRRGPLGPMHCTRRPMCRWGIIGHETQSGAFCDPCGLGFGAFSQLRNLFRAPWGWEPDLAILRSQPSGPNRTSGGIGLGCGRPCFLVATPSSQSRSIPWPTYPVWGQNRVPGLRRIVHIGCRAQPSFGPKPKLGPKVRFRANANSGPEIRFLPPPAFGQRSPVEPR